MYWLFEVKRCKKDLKKWCVCARLPQLSALDHTVADCGVDMCNEMKWMIART